MPKRLAARPRSPPLEELVPTSWGGWRVTWSCGPLVLGRNVGNVEKGGGPALHPAIRPIVAGGRGGRSMPRHFLHSGQVDTQIRKVPDPAPTQIVRRRRLDLGLAASLPADLPGRSRAQPGQALR